MADLELDRIERQQLCDLFEEVGPDAPTLLEGWTTHDLVAHLVLRERDRLAAPGIIVPGPWSRFAERRRLALVHRNDFPGLVERVRSGPPPGFFRLRWVGRLANLNEFFVHHEDVRRANGREPRTNPPRLDDALWANTRRAPWFLARGLRGVGLELVRSGTGERVLARRGEPIVHITGDPGEVLLYLFGRKDAAHVDIAGPPDAIEVVRNTPFGI